MTKDKSNENYQPYGSLDVDLGTPPPCYLSMQARLLEYSPDKV